MKKAIPVILLLGVLAAGGWYFYGKYRNEEDALVLHGNVDIRGVDLGFRVSGRIAEVLKDEGDAVKAGELLARIDAEPYQRELDQAKATHLQAVASLEQAKASLVQAKADADLKRAGYRTEEVEQARASLAQAKVTMENSERAYQRQSTLVKTNGVSRQNFENAEAAYHEAEQRMKVAEASLKQLESGFRVEEVAAAEAGVGAAQAAAGAAEAAVVRAEAAVKTAEIKLQDTELKSPSDGIVITRAQEPGAIVQAGPTVLSLSLEDPVWVRAYVHEPELGKFPPGTKVEVLTDGRPDQPFHGTVGFVSPRAEFTPKTVETQELRTSLVYRMRVVVDDSDGSLRQGMPVRVQRSAE
ncbi:efflux RND transporter periplasmic adaptor subunit [Luteolibacter sp. GHJ8]|uniref:Efflux RND transporter periplasmic adaptor subunit n=1 Tax=Luteolibacter rhizosphaerae TaxID=2989719 RepID=A0ABT3GCJ4_9BACT|nr:efflux RND transporter periplasmic adaptor subunit [Luteolibacter rhizosphaerae]MCW1916940.1 efflux RND transporter periplasmic adaptor subunit [Luteolibacter rhizosphaerae]